MTHKKIIKWLPAVLWAALIFYFSAQPVLEASENSLLDFLIKKGAHVTEYAVLFFLITQAQTKKNLRLAFLIGLFYAFTDETHQLFTPGRGGTLRDVLFFDTLGLSLGWLLLSKDNG